MLTNLTSKSLAGLGAVVTGGMKEATVQLSNASTKNKTITQTSFRSLYVHDSQKTAIDKNSGTAILFCGHEPDNLRTFLLDKTVLLNPGVFYRVLPLIGSAEIAVCAPLGTRLVPIGLHERSCSILPLIEPTEIHTLLYHEKERGFSFKGECHDFWELTYVERGTLHNVVDGIDYTQSQGEIMLFLPNQFHSQYAEPNERVFYTTISFSMQFRNPDFFNGHIFTADHEIKTLFRRIFEEKDFGILYGNDLILCYLKELIIRLLRTDQVEAVVRKISPESRPAIENTIIAATESYVRKNLNRPLSVAEIAESIPISRTYLSALYKKVTGESLIHFINTEKMNAAKDYIAASGHNFTQIAQLLGYNNVHYFSQTFKRYTGMTPSTYAKLYKGESS
ncbi:MAG: AraC family transcriptional regulator [Clostridia bacterium]|nr:AraC family transcriptional regulator [Clostridia bacterium]